jgi:hypothetical protein
MFKQHLLITSRADGQPGQHQAGQQNGSEKDPGRTKHRKTSFMVKLRLSQSSCKTNPRWPKDCQKFVK